MILNKGNFNNTIAQLRQNKIDCEQLYHLTLNDFARCLSILSKHCTQEFLYGLISAWLDVHDYDNNVMRSCDLDILFSSMRCR